MLTRPLKRYCQIVTEQDSHARGPPKNGLPARAYSLSPTINLVLQTGPNTSFKRFPFNGFTYYFTLFSKFFSSFVHTTCSLSVSDLIFSFRRDLPPTLGSIPKLPDSSRKPYICKTVRLLRDSKTGLSPSLVQPFQVTFVTAASQNGSSLLYNSDSRTGSQIKNLSFSVFTRRY